MLAPSLALLAMQASGEATATCHPNEHAPVGVMDVRCPMDRTWLVSLSTSFTHFDGLREGSQSISTGAALAQGYSQVPTSMDMSMTMLEVMFAPSEVLTLGASVPWTSNSMEMRTNLGESFKMKSEGIGDVQVGGDLVVWQLGEQLVTTGISVGIPTGSITEEGGMSGAPPTRLEYPMQLGSGTYDLSGRLDYRSHADPYAYGVELAGTTRLDHNDEGYALGDRFNASAWAAQEWTATLSGSVRVTASRWGNVRGADPLLDPLLSPTNDPKKQAGKRLDAALGLNWMPFGGKLSASVVGLELGMPLAEDLDGPQLSAEWFAVLGVGLSF
jgi:hypothetical protein